AERGCIDVGVPVREAASVRRTGLAASRAPFPHNPHESSSTPTILRRPTIHRRPCGADVHRVGAAGRSPHVRGAVGWRVPCLLCPGNVSRPEETMKIVVIGGSGLIGTKLVNRLRSGNNEVVAASLA